MERSIMKTFAIAAFAALLSIFSVDTYAELGGNPQLNNNYFGHLNDYQKALLVNNEEHHLDVALTKLASGKKSQLEYVKQQLQYLLPRWPNHPRALQIVSEVAVRTNDTAYALRWYTKAISAFPRVYQTYVLYGSYLYRVHEYDKAEKNFREAVQLAPDSSEPNYDLGLVLFAKKRYKEANHYAQIAYQLGYPLEGLRELLKGKGAWKPSDGGAVQASAATASVGSGSSR